ncbi:hypothetical protein AB0H83_33330 [Dactylosporangium sp. NPDC050688]|uniref:hypothetical protein n=1 Tax=Dactylosporangium sp. NPDC050688 TaxID=3157217 RepID=UPI0033FED852
MDDPYRLAAAGLIFLGLVELERPLVPPELATLACGRPLAEGIYPRFVCTDEDPDLVDRANRGWFDLCRAGGLFGDDREFLVAVEIDAELQDWWWARVRLADAWDIAGVGAAGALGTGFGRPEFGMLSVAGDIIVFCTSDPHSISAVLVPGSAVFDGMRKLANWKAEDPRLSPHERATARRWLSSMGD